MFPKKDLPIFNVISVGKVLFNGALVTSVLFLKCQEWKGPGKGPQEKNRVKG